MRSTFISTLVDLAAQDERIVLLTGDLGYLAIEPFAERFPERFFNVGVAEQQMVGMATGLAEAGYIPFCYSIVTFATLRPYEFIRNGPVLHNLPVRIVGVGGGVEYGHNGPTHYGIEDVGVMRVQPGLMVVAPADYAQTRTALTATWDHPGPVFYRLGKDERTTVPGLDGRYAPGRVDVLRDGSDALLVAMGSVAAEAAAAADLLAADGIACGVAVVSTLNPAPAEDLAALLRGYSLALSVEAHYLVGGVGSLTAEVCAEEGLRCRLVRCGIGRAPAAMSGRPDHLYHVVGISREALAA
ncbi:MAG TPA: transketolase C-terminal domain-containing protein, partial [Chloroflexaceae bacterium]|nr:transketolase C-terminal domain-containing protein [Chloroflexaceae bacterium]